MCKYIYYENIFICVYLYAHDTYMCVCAHMYVQKYILLTLEPIEVKGTDPSCNWKLEYNF